MLEVVTRLTPRRSRAEDVAIQARLETITQPLDDVSQARPLEMVIEPAGYPTRIDMPAPPRPEQARLEYGSGVPAGEIACSDDDGAVVLGRGEQATIGLDDPFVHRVHAFVHWDEDLGVHVIADAGGANGTFVNGMRARSPRRLSDGTRIRVGKTELVYRTQPGDRTRKPSDWVH